MAMAIGVPITAAALLDTTLVNSVIISINALSMTGPGGYKFVDFIRVGIPLIIIMWIGFSIVLPLIYDLG